MWLEAAHVVGINGLGAYPDGALRCRELRECRGSVLVGRDDQSALVLPLDVVRGSDSRQRDRATRPGTRE